VTPARAAVLVGWLLLLGPACSVAEPDTVVGTATAERPAVPRSTGESVQRARRADSAVVAEAPRTLTLPDGRGVPIDTVGSTDDGRLAVPSDIDRAGWWRGGSRLGDPFGSTLVAAHVDSRTQGLGPFVDLLSVAPGERVQLASEHLVQTFVIRSRRLVAQGSLDLESWIFDVSGRRRLTLVTCAPPYDHAKGRYLNLAVVTAVPDSSVERR